MNIYSPTISGSLTISGSILTTGGGLPLTGSLVSSGSFTSIGNTTISGSLLVSGSKIGLNSNGSIYSAYDQSVVSQGSTISGSIYAFTNTSGTESDGAILLYDNTAKSLDIRTRATAGNLNLYTKDISRLFISSSGNIGIGTSTVWNPGGSNQISVDLYNAGGSTYSTYYARSGTVVGAVSAESINSQFVVGTTSTHNLAFYTNNTVKMTISSSGNVGIGTSSPSYPLSVYKNASSTDVTLDVSNAGTYGLIGVRRGTQTGASAGINFYTTTAQKWFAGIYEGSDNFGFYSTAYAGFPLVITTGSYVGIGTSNPTFGKLQINSDNQDELALCTATNANQQLVLGYNLAGNYGRIQSVNQGTSYTNLVLQKDGGNVGIGTSTPEGPLHVYGSSSGGYIGMAITNYNSTANTSTGIDFGSDASSCYNGSGNGQINVLNTGGVGTANKSEMNLKIWNGSALVTGIKISDAGKVTFPTATSMANSCSNATAITVNTSTFTTVASVTITTTGKPVLIVGTGDMNPVGGPTWFYHTIYRDGSEVSHRVLAESAASSMNVPFAVCYIDAPSAGSHTYDIRVSQGGGYAATYGETGNVQAPTIFAVEIL